MHLTTRNVNTAFRSLVELFQEGRIETNPERSPRVMAERLQVDIINRPSRNGPVMMIDAPVMITYTHPRERVLFNQARDANPFFHLYEALWMLAGRNDVASLSYYTSKMAQFSDDGKTFNGAYGNRWRHVFPAHANGMTDSLHVDQLDVIVNHLKADPNSRRAVLQMWNVEDDLLKIGSNSGHPVIDLEAASKDVCCNLNVMFSIREVNTGPGQYGDEFRKYLDMTVTNRSNDMILGMLGANFVHFTFLQEYMAARLGVEVGRYTQMTNNLHVYESNWKPDEWLVDVMTHKYDDTMLRLSMIPLIKDPIQFDKELPLIVDKKWEEAPIQGEWQEPFFAIVVDPMLRAFYMHKNNDKVAALSWCNKIAAYDWRIAATNWIKKRIKIPT